MASLSQQKAIHLPMYYFTDSTETKRKQLDSSSCGVFICVAAACLAKGVPVNFTQDDIPLLRKYLTIQMANPTIYFQIPTRTLFENDHGDYLCTSILHLLSLPNEILEIILKYVLTEGDHMYYTLSLVCKHISRIVSQTSFKCNVHYAWLNSVYNWNESSKEYKEQYFVDFEIRRCIQCNQMYKEMYGFIGCGKFGEFHQFYSEHPNPGFCSHECYPDTF